MLHAKVVFCGAAEALELDNKREGIPIEKLNKDIEYCEKLRLSRSENLSGGNFITVYGRLM